MIDKVKAQSRHRKNTDQNTTKTPIKMPQKHRLKCRKNTDLSGIIIICVR